MLRSHYALHGGRHALMSPCKAWRQLATTGASFANEKDGHKF